MPTYQYENSDSERFQEFAQSLLLAEWPGLQCFPVGQPDGGRDAIHVNSDGTFTVMQVKFKRLEEEVDSIPDWMIAALRGEIEKVEKLKAAGGTEYLMVTNARGTAHLGGGSIDRVQEWMNENMPLPSRCLWRGDLDRRLDGNFDLKWRYPEFLNGTDGVRLAFESISDPGHEQRTLAVRAFLKHQMKADSKVRFKQVELSNDLLALFIDVPIRPSAARGRRIANRHLDFFQYMMHRRGRWADDGLRYYMVENEYGDTYDLQPFDITYGGYNVGAATFLLDSLAQQETPRIVLEGAPGQGKSTLAQYVCQVHRARFLNATELLSQFPEEHTNTSIRLPIKVDLRNLATWLDGRDPFHEDNPPVGGDWEPTLESFLARLICAKSGGISFSAYDVARVLATAPSIIFLDGLDEVADVEMRKRLVTTVDDGLDRLTPECDIQVIVTTRPAAFANSPGFSKSQYFHLELETISRELAVEYADKWIAASDLDDEEAYETRRIFNEKLDLPHIRDLSRNPMQLAIVLSLVHTLGHSLPDQRTDLYAQYMDRFLTREAEKSVEVRTHRPLLVKLHQYVAWKLQSQAETSSGTSGSISPAHLRELLKSYLEDHKHPLDILDDLFAGTVERIYLLVLGPGDEYEFEVQPVREYFCASYLYESAASYSHPERGLQPHGTKDDRFDAMAQNPYWTNVLRFYAGRYNSGELGGLYLRLEELQEKFPHTFRPRELATMLLSDWVFTSNPRATQHVVSATFDPLGCLAAASNFRHYSGTRPALSLPEGCGRSEIAGHVVKVVDEHLREPGTKSLGRLLSANRSAGIDDLLLEKAAATTSGDRSLWLDLFAQACETSRENADRVLQLTTSDGAGATTQASRWIALMGSTPWLGKAYPEVTESVLRRALDGWWLGVPPVVGRTDSWLSRFLTLTNPSRSQPMRSLRVARQRRRPSSPSEERIDLLLNDCPTDVEQFLRAVLTGIPLEVIARGDSSLEPWSFVVDQLNRAFGANWSSCVWAIHAAGITSKAEVGAGATALFDSTVDICQRARYARLKRAASWWNDQLGSADGDEDVSLWLLILLTYGGPQILGKLMPAVSKALDTLSPDSYVRVIATLRGTMQSAGARANRSLAKFLQANDLGARTNGLALALTLELDIEFLAKVEKSDVHPYVSALVRRDIALHETKPVEGKLSSRAVKAVSEYYSLAGTSPRFLAVDSRNTPFSMNQADAELILTNPLSYPWPLVQVCEAFVSSALSAKRVSEIADADGWTFE